MKYRPEIDGLRAVAVLPVIFFHAGFRAFSGGFVGVDIFFVISGYLITTIIRDDLDSGTFTIGRFYERRARRILPALLLVCIASVPLFWVTMPPTHFKGFASSLIAANLFGSNLLFWHQAGYFETAAELKPLLHTWSLSLEEQFYLLFPPLLILLHRVRPTRAQAIVAAITAASFAAAQYCSSAYPVADFYLLPTRAWELGAGSLLALAGGFAHRLRPAAGALASMLGILLVAYAVGRFDSNTPFPSAYTLLPVVGATLIIACANRDNVVGRLLGLPGVVWIGLISYSFYLWHQPLLVLARIWSLYRPSELMTWGAIAASLVAAILSWHFVEKPFRNRQRVPTPYLAAAAITASASLVIVGALGWYTNGFENLGAARSRYHALEQRLAVNQGLNSACDGEAFALVPACRTSDDPVILVWGDSFAMQLVDGLVAANPRAKIVQMTKSMCGPIVGIAPIPPDYPRAWAPGCLKFNRDVLDWLATKRTVRYAVLSSPFSQYVGDDATYLTEQGIRGADPQVPLDAFLRTLDELQRRGITPLVVSPPPTFGGDIGQCLLKAAYRGRQLGECDFPVAAYEQASAPVSRFLERVGQRHRVLWLKNSLCDRETCSASIDGAFIYRDSRHLSHEGSALLGRRIDLYRLATTGADGSTTQ